MMRGVFVFVPGTVAAVAGLLWWYSVPRSLSPESFAAHYVTPLSPQRPASVYHLGHSLVGRDMPAMLSQIMANRYHSQLGWGASLDQHWRGEVPGFADENQSAAFRPAHDALASGAYDAVVLTEMVELKDAIRWHDSADALARWARHVRHARPDTRIYLYETWHHLDDPAGWEARIRDDLPELWSAQVLRPAMAQDGVGTVHLIPAGQVLATAARAIDAGTVPGLTTRDALFARNPDGTRDTIHLSDTGHYLVALTHFAVLSSESPEGLPHNLRRADGSAASLPGAEAAQVLQNLVWQVVRAHPVSGVTAGPEGI